MEEEEAKNESNDNIYSNFKFANSGLITSNKEFGIIDKPETNLIIDFLNADYKYNKSTLETYNKYWKEIMDNKDEYENDFLKIFEKLYSPRLEVENDMSVINKKAYNNIRNNDDKQGGYTMMYDYMNGVGQSLRSARGYCFQSCVCMALNAMATLNNSPIRFYNEISFKNFSEVMVEVSHTDKKPLTSKTYEKRRIDIVAVNNKIPAAIIISCKGGWNNTDTEDDVIRQYASTYTDEDGNKLCGYILVTRIHYKGAGRTSQYTYAKNKKDEDVYISHLYDGVVSMFRKIKDNSQVPSKKEIKLVRKIKNDVINLYNRSNEEEYKYLGDTLMEKQKEQFTNRAKAFCYVTYDIKSLSVKIPNKHSNSALLNDIFKTLNDDVLSLEEDESGLARKTKQLSVYRYVRLIWYFLKHGEYPNFYHYIKDKLQKTYEDKKKQFNKNDILALNSFEDFHNHNIPRELVGFIKKMEEEDKKKYPIVYRKELSDQIESTEFNVEEFDEKWLEEGHKGTNSKAYENELFKQKKIKFINENKRVRKERYIEFIQKVFSTRATISGDEANKYWENDLMEIQEYFKGGTTHSNIIYYTPQLLTIDNDMEYDEEEDDEEDDEEDEEDEEDDDASH